MRRLLIALLAIAILAALCLGCGGGDEFIEWQRDFLERQREGLPTSTPTPQAVSGFAGGG